MPSGTLLQHVSFEKLRNDHFDVLVDRVNVPSEAPCPAHSRVRQAIGERQLPSIEVMQEDRLRLQRFEDLGQIVPPHGVNRALLGAGLAI